MQSLGISTEISRIKITDADKVSSVRQCKIFRGPEYGKNIGTSCFSNVTINYFITKMKCAEKLRFNRLHAPTEIYQNAVSWSCRESLTLLWCTSRCSQRNKGSWNIRCIVR